MSGRLSAALGGHRTYSRHHRLSSSHWRKKPPYLIPNSNSGKEQGGVERSNACSCHRMGHGQTVNSLKGWLTIETLTSALSCVALLFLKVACNRLPLIWSSRKGNPLYTKNTVFCQPFLLSFCPSQEHWNDSSRVVDDSRCGTVPKTVSSTAGSEQKGEAGWIVCLCERISMPAAGSDRRRSLTLPNPLCRLRER